MSGGQEFQKFFFFGTATEKIYTGQVYDVQAINIFLGIFFYNANYIPVFHPIVKLY